MLANLQQFNPTKKYEIEIDILNKNFAWKFYAKFVEFFVTLI